MIPEEFLNKMRLMLGDEYEEFAAAYERERYTGLRLNPRKLKPGHFKELDKFGLSPVPWAENGFYYKSGRPGLHPWHEGGLYYLQEPSAMAPAELLAPKPGERVLDMCAAPGGKSTQLAAMLGQDGLLVSNEINTKRAAVLSRNIERMGIPNALVLNEHPRKLAESFPGYFDRVLVDAPCSGEGMFLKEEAAAACWSGETVRMCAQRQLSILLSAAETVKPGGRLVYSTCTFSREENEDVIISFLEKNRDFQPEDVTSPMFSPGYAPGCLRLWPHRIKGEGHFAAVLRKTGGEEGSRGNADFSPVPEELENFCTACGITMPYGRALMFGQTVYIMPENMPDIRGLKVLRPGLEAGKLLKGRFEPAHALALWLNQCACMEDFPADSPEIRAYLRGETIKSGKTGWTLILASGVSLGWAKGSGGILKNHYPKGLRRMQA